MDILDLSTEAKKARRKALVAALRSGNYQQTTGVLCSLDSGAPRYCCLGLACVLVRQPDRYDVGDVAWKDGDRKGIVEALVLPVDICAAYGFISQSGSFKLTDALKEKFPKLKKYDAEGFHHDTGFLTTLNDKYRWSFQEIADLIEAEPEGMFTD